jgi:adenosine kinase
MSATTLDVVSDLLNKVDESKDASTDCDVQILGMGNPLLDISSPVDDALMKKYDLKPGNAILAEDKHLPIYEELAAMKKVEYIGGGSTLNSMRVAQWMLQKPGTVGYFGKVGKDKFAETLRACTAEAGVTALFPVDEKTPTGTCAVCITDKERSLVANVAAANNFNVDDIESPEAKKMMESAKVIYSAGFFLTASAESMLKAAKLCNDANKPYCMNLSAEFISAVFKAQLLTVLPYVRILFANKDEAVAFAKANEIKYDSIKELAVKMSQFEPSLTKEPRIAVVTQGSDAVYVATLDKVNTYPVPKVEKDKIVDVNGAGDAFVGGFLSQYISGKDEETCVRAGIYAAQYMIQRAGTKLEGKPMFDVKK